MNSSSESMSIAPMIDLLIVLSSGAQAPARYLPPLPAQLRRERLNCIVEPTAHTISRGIKVGAPIRLSLPSVPGHSPITCMWSVNKANDFGLGV